MDPNTFTIRDLENLSGIKAHTIRIWEQRYDFLKPSRTNTNIRYYGSRELKIVLDVSLLNKYGYKISHLNRMSPEELQDKITGLADKEARQQRLINELIAHMIEFDIETFEKVLDSHILSFGIEKTILQVVFPFLDRIGILWKTHHINPAQEHLVSHVIRQKLLVGIERAPVTYKSKKTVLLFLPEDEHHELGLLYVNYLLRAHGVSTLYLGADLPLKDLESVCQHRKPDFLYAHFSGIPRNFNFDKFCSRIAQRIGIPLVVSGTLARPQLRKLPSTGVDLRSSLLEVQTFVASL